MGPYLQLATICERFILENDGALTLFRVIDRFVISGTTQDMPQTAISFNVVVNFRSGHFTGSLDLDLEVINPNIQMTQKMQIPASFEGPEEKAFQLIGNITMMVAETGLYWITVKLAGEEKTRIPIRVLYQRQPTISTGVIAPPA